MKTEVQLWLAVGALHQHNGKAIHVFKKLPNKPVHNRQLKIDKKKGSQFGILANFVCVCPIIWLFISHFLIISF